MLRTKRNFLPILAAVAVGLSMDPLLLIVPTTIASLLAYQLPIRSFIAAMIPAGTADAFP